MSPAELVADARAVAALADRKLGASRYLAASFLLRQALEDALDRLWAAKVPGLEEGNGRVQMVSLPFYMDPDAARDVVYCWYRLSSACHHDVYDLPPTPAEFDHYVDVTDRSVAALLAAAAAADAE